MKISDAFRRWGVIEQSSIGGYTMADSKSMMDTLGIKNTRALCDGANGEAGLPSKMFKAILDNGAGIFCTVPYAQTVFQFIKALKSITTNYPGQLIGIGGPNEPSNFGFTSEYGGCGTVNGGPDRGSRVAESLCRPCTPQSGLILPLTESRYGLSRPADGSRRIPACSGLEYPMPAV